VAKQSELLEDRDVAFNRKEVEELLKKCHRRCCICHRFCGVKIETDHIDPKAESDDDSIDNAIPLCFDCHAEIHSYNDKHPRGRKYTPGELRGHRDQWLEICGKRPEAMLAAAWDGDVGPLQALMDELEFNKTIARCSTETKRGGLFENVQFLRAIQEGKVTILKDELKNAILQAYAAVSRANQHILAEVNQDVKMTYQGTAAIKAREAIVDATPLIDAAYNELARFLCREEGG
jgi:hypothetical protein